MFDQYTSPLFACIQGWIDNYNGPSGLYIAVSQLKIFFLKYGCKISFFIFRIMVFPNNKIDLIQLLWAKYSPCIIC